MVTRNMASHNTQFLAKERHWPGRGMIAAARMTPQVPNHIREANWSFSMPKTVPESWLRINRMQAAPIVPNIIQSNVTGLVSQIILRFAGASAFCAGFLALADVQSWPIDRQGVV